MTRVTEFLIYQLSILAHPRMALQKLEDNKVLAPGLYLFGNNAYLNTPYLATPYAAVTGGTKDAYNFYHSQARICIDAHSECLCTDGQFYGALAQLHNFCIVEANDTVVLPATARDAWQNEVNSAVPLVCKTQHPESGGITPTQLLDGGNHFDDVGINGCYNQQQCYENMAEMAGGAPLPRERLHSFVASKGLS